MKKFVAMLLVLTMVLALAGTAMASCKIKADMYVKFHKDTHAYSDHKSSAKTGNVVDTRSVGYCVKTCGNYAKVLVNVKGKTYCWFRIKDLCEYKGENPGVLVIWAKGGKGMSTCRKWTIGTNKDMFHGYIKVTGHTNLRVNPGMKFKSQGKVEKCDKLKLTGRYGYDDRYVPWLEIKKGCKKLWVSSMFVKLTRAQALFLVENIH